MTTYFIETSVIIGYLRGVSEATERIDSLEGNLVSGYVCLAELFEGVYRVRNRDHAEKAVLQFFASLQGVLSLNTAVAREFGRLRADLKQKGQVLEDLDLLIAATCLANDVTLVTDNYKHFSRVPGLRIHKNK